MGCRYIGDREKEGKQAWVGGNIQFLGRVYRLEGRLWSPRKVGCPLPGGGWTWCLAGFSTKGIPPPPPTDPGGKKTGPPAGAEP